MIEALLFAILLLIVIFVLGLFSGFFAIILLGLQKLLRLFKRRRKIRRVQTTLNGYLETRHDKLEEPYKDNETSELKGFESSAVMDMEDSD